MEKIFERKIKMSEIGVVIVTFNRINLLKVALERYNNQTQLPRYILVIDNCSTDGTKEYLDKWQTTVAAYEKCVIHNTTNKGGSGGFHDGLEKAVLMDANWIWVADDDAFPESDAIEKAEIFLRALNDSSECVAAFCGAVINNGNLDLLHRRSEIKSGCVVKESVAPATLYKMPYFEINCFSYVGTIMNKKALEQYGITNENYYICYDDSEHSLRLRRYGKIFCVPSIRVHHDVAAVSTLLDWKTYYYYRNNLHMIKAHFPIYCTAYLALRYSISAIYKMLVKGEKQKGEVILLATRDALLNNLGKHSIYKPGWKPQI